MPLRRAAMSLNWSRRLKVKLDVSKSPINCKGFFLFDVWLFYLFLGILSWLKPLNLDWNSFFKVEPFPPKLHSLNTP